MPEPVRKAARRLAPLLQRRGTSPEVGKALRRAVESLDFVLATGDVDAQLRGLRSAVAELEACLTSIKASSRPADHEQAPGVASVLKLLTFILGPATEILPPAASPISPPASARAERHDGAIENDHLVPASASSAVVSALRPGPVAFAPVISPPSEALATALPPGSPDPPESVAPPHRQAPGPADLGVRRSAMPTAISAQQGTTMIRRQPRNEAALAEHLERLVAAGRRRAIALEHLAITWRELASLERKIESEARVLRWLGAPLEVGVRRLAAVRDLPGVMLDVASCAVGSTAALKGGRGAPLRSDPSDLGTYVSILRACAWRHGADTLARTFTLHEAHSRRALLLAPMVEWALVDSAALVGLLDDTDDHVTVEAARLLAWMGGPEERRALSDRARTALTSDRGAAFTVAAVALGDGDLLNEVRARVAQDGAAPRLLDALVLAGGASDAEILVQLARRPGPLATAAVRAAGRLGNPHVVADLARLEGALPPEAVRAALGEILGRAGADTSEKTSRLFRGEPWSVAAVMKAVTNPDEPVMARGHLALELVTRTGIRPASPYDHLASARAQAKAAASLEAVFERQQPFPSGRWLSRGYVLRR